MKASKPEGHCSGAAVPAVTTGVSPAKTHAGETPAETGETPAPLSGLSRLRDYFAALSCSRGSPPPLMRSRRLAGTSLNSCTRPLGQVIVSFSSRDAFARSKWARAGDCDVNVLCGYK